jgi:hypothetical protein
MSRSGLIPPAARASPSAACRSQFISILAQAQKACPRGEAPHDSQLAKPRGSCLLAPSSEQGVMSNVVELKAHQGATNEVAPSNPDLRALQELQALCAKAIAAGGLDAGGPTTLDFTVAVHRAIKGTEWNVRFYRGLASEL